MPITNAILARWSKGYRSATNTASVSAYGRREGFVSFSEIEELGAVDSSLRKTVDEQAALQTAVTLGIEPTTDADTPYLGAFVRDNVTAPNIAGTPTQYRMVACTATIDDEGFATFVPELETRSDVVSDRTKLWLKRIGNGTLAGRSAKASLVKELDKRIVVEKVEPIRPPTFSQAKPAQEISSRWQPDKAFRLTQVDATLLTPGTTATTIVVLKNNATVLTLTIPAGVYHVVSLPTSVSFKRSDYLSVATTAAGTNAAELLVELIGGPAY
jgi:hypothetical protein